MMEFDLSPFVGALPIQFGMPSDEVTALLGKPRSTGKGSLWGEKGEVVIGFDSQDLVDHFGFGPGELSLKFRGETLWTLSNFEDPNPILLKYDSSPVEHVGFLIFLKLGIQTTGFHDDEDETLDYGDKTISMFPKSGLQYCIDKGGIPDLRKYTSS